MDEPLKKIAYPTGGMMEASWFLPLGNTPGLVKASSLEISGFAPDLCTYNTVSHIKIRYRDANSYIQAHVGHIYTIHAAGKDRTC